MVTENSNKINEINVLALLRELNPFEFDQIEIKQVTCGYLLNQPYYINTDVIRRMWIYFRHTDPIARGLGDLPPIDYGANFANIIAHIYPQYSKIFDQLLNLNEGVLSFRSNINIDSEILIVKNFAKIMIHILDVDNTSGELEEWQTKVNQVVLNLCNYQGPFVFYNLFMII